MANCEYIYKGKTYTKEELKKHLVNLNRVNYSLKIIDILQSPKAEQVFAKGEKNNWDLTKILNELGVSKQQQELIDVSKLDDIRDINIIIPTQFSNYRTKINVLDQNNNDIGYVEVQRLSDNTITLHPKLTEKGFGEILYQKFSEYFNIKASDESKSKQGNKLWEKLDAKGIVEKSGNIDANGEPVITLNIKSGAFKKSLIKNTQSTREQIITDLLANYSYTIEINTAKTKEVNNNPIDDDTRYYEKNGKYYKSTPYENEAQPLEITKEQYESYTTLNIPTQHYSNLSAPGGTNFKNKYEDNPDWEYQELEIATPAITPSIKGHAQFSTDNGIGWYRVWYNKKTGVVEVQEVQSDLFQKGRDKEELINEYSEEYQNVDGNTIEEIIEKRKKLKSNQFLQLLNKDNNWVTVFVKSIVQNSVKKGYEKVLFPVGDTAAKIEGHETVENYIKYRENKIIENEKELKTLNGEEHEDVKWGLERESKQFKKEIQDAKAGKLKISSIANFYENTIKNILNKTYGKENISRITDEYGNQWYELVIKEKSDNAVEVEDIYFEPEEIGVFNKYLQYKEGLARMLRNRLSQIKDKKRKYKSNEAIYSDLSTLEHEINLRLEGSEELGVKGLVQEINDLLEPGKVELNSVGYYIEKDIQRLDRLSKSNDAQDLFEAQKIINFYTNTGTFSKNVYNPFFSEDDIFFEDGTYKLEDFVMQPFKDYKDKVQYYQNIIDNKKESVTVDAINNNEKIKDLYGDTKSTFSDIIHKDDGLRDANWIDMWTMDISSGIFSTNSMLPQVMLNELQNTFEEKTKWSKHIEEKINELQPKVERELENMGYGFKALGIINIKGVSYDLFKQTDRNGRQTGRLVHRYSKEFFDTRLNMDDEFKRKIEDAEKEINPAEKNLKYAKAFQFRKSWYAQNVVVLDLNRLPEIVNNPEFSEFSSTFKADEADEYRSKIVAIIGEEGYKEEVTKQQEQIKSYNVAYKVFVDNVLNEAGVDDISKLSEKDKASINYWVTRNSPFKGIEDYYSPTGININDKRVYNFMQYNLSIPRKNIAKAVISDGKYIFNNTTTETGYYDKNYNTIESNNTLKEFHKVMSEVTKTIKDSLPYELQERMTVNTIPALKKNIIEILSDKNIPFFKSVSLAAREVYDKFQEMRGMVKQNPNSTSNVDVITGLPDYRVNTSFLEGNYNNIKREQILLTSKFLSLYNNNKEDEAKIKKITRFSSLTLDSFNQSSLIELANMLGVEPNKTAIKARTGDMVNIGRIIKDYSTHIVVQQQSFDLPKIAKYYSHLAMEYAARQEVLPIMQIMKEHYEEIKSPATTNAGEIITNFNGETRLTGLRNRANSQMEDWFERVVLNNYNTKHVGVIEALNSVLPKTVTEKMKNLADTLMGKNTNKIRYTEKEKEIITKIDEAISNETDEDRLKELQSLKDELGRNFSATATLDTFLNIVRLKGLGWNLSSQVTNLIEGTVSNMIIASTGDYFKPDYIYEGYHVVKGSFLKSVTLNKIQTRGAKKARTLMDRYRVLQDSSNELQKASTKSNFSWTKNLNPYELTRRVEYLNQTPLMIAILKDINIKGIDDTESSIWDAMDENGKLKDNFSTDENKKNWEDADGINYNNFKTKLTKCIVVAHGNYDDKRGMMAKSSTIGKSMLMFKTWMTSGFYQRFATEQDDLESGIKGYYGRYLSFTPATATAFFGMAGLLSLGPIGAILPASVAMISANIGGKKSDMGFFKELLYTTGQLFKKMLGMPINLAVGRNIVNSNGGFESMVGNGFSERDAKNMRANMADMAIILTWILMFLLAKGLFYDEDDKSDDPNRIRHNILVNRIMQLINQATAFSNPTAIRDNTVGSIGLLRFKDDLTKLAEEINDYFHGKDIITTGINAGESALYNQTIKTFMPGIFKGGYHIDINDPFTTSLSLTSSETQGEQVYPDNRTKFDDYFKSEGKLKEDEVKGERAKRRKQLEDDTKLTDKEINKIINKELPTPKQLEKRNGKKKTSK